MGRSEEVRTVYVSLLINIGRIGFHDECVGRCVEDFML
jgi:hypothetical protein